nr:immunoglobulin heavy chain junction region [Mus musculus]
CARGYDNYAMDYW